MPSLILYMPALGIRPGSLVSVVGLVTLAEEQSFNDQDGDGEGCAQSAASGGYSLGFTGDH